VKAVDRDTTFDVLRMGLWHCGKVTSAANSGNTLVFIRFTFVSNSDRKVFLLWYREFTRAKYQIATNKYTGKPNCP
jgi:hypothetical protein